MGGGDDDEEGGERQSAANDQQRRRPTAELVVPTAERERKDSTMKTKEAMDELEDRLEEVGIVKPPDGGYGWVVVLASFCSNAVVDGIIFTVSASLVPRWEQFFQNSSVTNVTSLLAGFYLLSGPLASALANCFGCKKVAIAGSFIAAIGFLISALIPALPVLYFAFGIVGGLGFGLVFLPAIVIVGQYFSEKRALATGIAVCGSGIGTAVFGQLNPILLQYFDQMVGPDDSWRIFLLFLSAVTLLCAIFGYFFQPLRPSDSQLEQVAQIATEFMELEEVTTAKQSIDDRRESSVPDTKGHVTLGVEIERFDKPSNQNGTLARKRQDSFSQRPFLSTLELLASRQAIDRPSTSNANLALEVSKAGVVDLNRPLSRMDVFYAASSLSLAERITGRRPTATGQRRSETMVDLEAVAQQQASARQMGKSSLYLSSAGLQTLGEAAKLPGGTFSPKWTHGIFASMRSMLDLSLLQSPTFMILAFSGFLTLFCFFVPFAFLGALADERINSNQNNNDPSNNSSANAIAGGGKGSSQLLLVLLGLFNVVGRVLCGFVADHPKVDPLIVSNLALIVGGVATALAPLLDELWMFALYCFPFAFGAASFAALRSIICVELLGIERLTSAFGMLMLFMGVAALLGPPFAKLLRNFTGSYGLPFNIMGVIMICSGVLCMPLRKINAWEDSGGNSSQRNFEKDAIDAPETELQPLSNKINNNK